MKSIIFVLAVAINLSNVVAESPTEEPAAAVVSRAANLPPMRSRLGVGWAFLYGYQGTPAVEFMSEIRNAGGGFGKIYLFWNQIEPKQGQYDWTAVDRFLDQLESPEEGLIAVFSSSEWATKKPSALLPPGPAKNLDDYYRFIFDLVSHCKGRARYWQNDCEPNNPVFWAGSREEYVVQLCTFYKAVKAADPKAIVFAGGYDGLFNPPGMFPMYNQQAGLEFFNYVLKEGRDAFDAFDLRLYVDPYTIPARVEVIRKMMRALGYEKPIVSTEYGGPGFFEFPKNLLYIPLVISWSKAASEGAVVNDPSGNQITKLYERMESLAPETQMFMQGCAAPLDEKLQRLQCREIAVRNVLALSAGVELTAYWQLASLNMQRDDMMMLMYGKIGMLSYEKDKVVRHLPVYDAFARTAKALEGVVHVKQIELPQQSSVYYFSVDRGKKNPLYVIWERRDSFSGEDEPATTVELDWPYNSVVASNVLGESVAIRAQNGRLKVPVSATPIFFEPGPDDKVSPRQTIP